jgi:hypothetical protein
VPNKPSDNYSSAVTTEGKMYEGSKEYLGLGIVKWCAICGTHKAQLGGTIQHVMGGRHWVCSKHKKAKP